MQPQPRKRKGFEPCALACAGRLSDSECWRRAEGREGKDVGQAQKKAGPGCSHAHLLLLPMLLYLLLLLREQGFCRQSAWQIPEQGQALLCP